MNDSAAGAAGPLVTVRRNPVLGWFADRRITAGGVTESQRAAADLAELSTRLHDLVSRFRY